MTHVPSIVLTGGPCAGKTTGLCYLQEKLSDFGFHVLTVPESPTLLIQGGITSQNNTLSLKQFQESVVRTMCALELEFTSVAQDIRTKKCVVLHDRGIMDASAYMPRPMFEEVIKDRGLRIADILGHRYDGIIFLRTAALGAEEFYTLDNNTARLETPEEARIVDGETLQAWNGHPHVRIIDNSTSFDKKLKRTLQAACRVLGIPVPLEIERKFLVRPVDMAKIGPYCSVEIEQMYLQNSNPREELRIRKRQYQDGCVYYQTTKQSVRPKVRVEKEKTISEDQYELSSKIKLPGSIILSKTRSCFIFQNQYFELDRYSGIHEGLWLLEIELTEENDKVEIPPFINVVKEVTDNKSYFNFSLATHN